MIEITDQDIAFLAEEAAQAGDSVMVAICEIALGVYDEKLHYEDPDPTIRKGLESIGIIIEHLDQAKIARDECIRVITNAKEL